jgi:Domain of unknown function (DUF4124)
MAGIRLSAIALSLAMAASPVAAETYKWVDAKGVVTYSDSPPPLTAKKPQVVEERISVIPPDPAFGPAVEAMRARALQRAQYEEADFARRQQYMLEAQASYAAAGDGYPAYYPYYGYGGWGYAVGGGARRFSPRVAHYRTPIRPYSSLPSYSSLPTYGTSAAGARPGGPRR